MDLGTVRSRLDTSTLNNVNKGNIGAMDSRPYKHPNDVHHDMKLVFDNAMRYNSAGSDVHVMAQTVLDKLETENSIEITPDVFERLAQDSRPSPLRYQLENKFSCVCVLARGGRSQLSPSA